MNDLCSSFTTMLVYPIFWNVYEYILKGYSNSWLDGLLITTDLFNMCAMVI